MSIVCMRCDLPLLYDEYCPHCSFGEACDCIWAEDDDADVAEHESDWAG